METVTLFYITPLHCWLFLQQRVMYAMIWNFPLYQVFDSSSMCTNWRGYFLMKAQAAPSAVFQADASFFFSSCRDVSTLDENNATFNNQMAFDILQKEFGIVPIMSASDFASSKEIDQLSVVLYLTQVHNAFSETPKPAGRCVVITNTTLEVDFLSLIYSKILHSYSQPKDVVVFV